MKSIYLILSAVLLSSCATIFSGTKDKIKIQSIPCGASVYLNHQYLCNSDTTILLKRKALSENALLTFTKEGFYSDSILIKTKAPNIGYLNIPLVFAAIIPCIVAEIIDEKSGANYKPTKTKYVKKLKPIRN